MSNYAKAVLWMGLFMIVAGIVRNWGVLSAAIFGNVNSGLKVPGPGGLPQVGGKCPPGYTSAYGRCWSPAQQPVPPAQGTV